VVVFLFGVGFFAFVFISRDKEPIISPSVQRIIFVNKEVKISASGLDKAALGSRILDEIDREALSLNQILAITPYREINDPQSNEVEERVFGASEFLSLLADEVPQQLLRALEEDYLYGVHAFEEKIPFLILKVRDYENAFGGMLEWQKSLAILRDFDVLFGVDRFPPVEVTEFTDVLIKNRDVRIIKDKDRELILLYSFTDRETLVLTTHGTTFDEILNRLATPTRTLR